MIKNSMENVTKYMETTTTMYNKAFDAYMNGLNNLYKNQEQMAAYAQQALDRANTMGVENQKVAETLIKQAKNSQLQYKNVISESVSSAMNAMPTPNMEYMENMNAKIMEMMKISK